MDGLLIVDKPSGPTSHDIVALARRVLRERRIGHTGTLDPMASGVLPLVIGRATRLARFISGDKTYEATIRLGVETDTCDALGTAVGPAFTGSWPSAAAVDAALQPFRGTFLQQPPAYSAKKIAGRRSYDIARRAATAGAASSATEPVSENPVLPEPVSVTAFSVDVLDVSGSLVQLRVRCSAGFYIRALAHDLGRALGTGAHLATLRRTEAAGFGLGQAIPLDVMRADGGDRIAGAALIPMERMLGNLRATVLSADGVAHVRVGRDLGPADAVLGFGDAVAAEQPVRLLDSSGQLVAMAVTAKAPGLLHPAVVLL
jgi:tRNA pseudouridine55 synthase